MIQPLPPNFSPKSQIFVSAHQILSVKHQFLTERINFCQCPPIFD
uniref:Uncharacterized protein n=1 Tax=Anopheles funestus TaxID=62324 RepID=A0A182S3X3_ANOFN